MNVSYRQLLVHLDSGERAAGRLALARRMAGALGADVAALYAVTPTLVALPAAPMIGPDLSAGMMEFDQSRRQRTRAMFDRVMEDSGPQVVWRELPDPPVIGGFSQQALYADLLVLGQHEPSSPQALDVPADFAESVMLASGKPALVVPYVGSSPSVGECVVIAWKETREAARALAASLPLLQRAREVHVLTWDASEPPAGAMLDLAGYLKLHEVAPVLHPQGKEPDFLGELLLSGAFDLGADLLVMGCYGHGRAREWVLGGTTRTVLRSMTLPVLMAH
ncbi:MAG TPA: universal stress protein [Ramlibacter sp.]|nr:universal stress protein [Ramlibacter sp.]